MPVCPNIRKNSYQDESVDMCTETELTCVLEYEKFCQEWENIRKEWALEDHMQNLHAEQQYEEWVAEEGKRYSNVSFDTLLPW